MYEHIRVPLTPREALSGVAGSVSLAAWVFVLVPQLYENYIQGNANGVSVLFIVVWLFGDFTNLIGASLAGLVPTVIALAVYFCIADVILLLQCLYYNLVSGKRSTSIASLADTRVDERRSLIGSRNSDNSGLPGSRRASSFSQQHLRRGSDGQDAAQATTSLDSDKNSKRSLLKYTASVFAIFSIGLLGWAIAWKTRLWRPSPLDNIAGEESMGLAAEFLGYFSAICYVGARLPQIYKNYRGKTCEGLSLLFFILSTVGNATYGAGIIFHSTEKEYVLVNTPWLIGSFGTMLEDAIIFYQFRLYRVIGDV